MNENINIDFKKILEEDEQFRLYAKDVVFDSFTAFNPQLVSTIWALYQSGMDKNAASFTVKQLIRFGGPPHEPPRRNSPL